MKQRHTVPTHMNLPDKLLFGLTARQVLTLLIGLLLGYQCWLQTRFLDPFGLVGLVVRIGFVAVPILCAVLVTFLVIRHRFLEVWALVWLRYQSLPKTYTWQRGRVRRDEKQQRYPLTIRRSGP